MFSRKTLSIVLACSLLIASHSATSAVSLSLGYSDFSTDTEGFDISLSAMTLGVGYELQTNSERFTLMPEFKIGVGVSDDTAELFGDDVFPADVEVRRYLALSIRGNYALSDSAYVFIQPAYANLDVEVSAFGTRSNDDEWEFGFGIGAGFSPSEAISLEVSYESFDDTDVLSGLIRYRF